MHSRPRAFRRLALPGLAGLLVLLAGASAITAHAGVTPQVTADDQTDLLDGQFVTLTYSGLTGADQVTVYQCSANPASLTKDCGPTSTGIQIDASGNGSDVVKVRYGAITSSTVCDSADPCTLVGFPDSAPNGAFATALQVAISFAKTNSGCPTPTDEPTGQGSNAADRAFRHWLPVSCVGPYNAPVDWTTGSDSEGRQNLVTGARDFGVSERSLTSDDTGEELSPTTFAYVPLTLSGTTFAYNLHDAHTGARITDLKLSPDVLTKIFTGQITTWETPEIEQENPTHTFPQQLRAVVRADECNTSLQLSSWFEAQDKADYEAGGKVYQQQGATDLYPDPRGSLVYNVTGEPALAAALTAPETIPANDSYTTSTQGVIGVLDTTAAAVAGLPTANLLLPDGSTVSANTADITKGFGSMSVDSTTGVHTPDYPSLTDGSWPLANATYALVPQQTLPTTKLSPLSAFLSYATGTGQTDGLAAGYVPLPSDARTTATSVINSLTPSAALAPTTQPTVVPSAIPAPLPSAASVVIGVPSPSAPAATPVVSATATTTTATQPGTTSAPVSAAGTGVGTVDPGGTTVANGADPVITSTGTTGQSEAAPIVAGNTGGAGSVTTPVPAAAPEAFAASVTSGSGAIVPIVALLILAGLVGGPLLLKAGRR